MIIYDFEVTKYDWLVCWLDCKTQKKHVIANNPSQLKKFYEYYKKEIMVGYNSRHYDKFILQGILCGFDPYKISQWIIVEDKKGHEFSKMLSKFPILNYDCSVFGKSLKQLEAYQGHSIVESEISFDIDRKLTEKELQEMIEYCMNDVMETFNVFVETSEEFESHVGLITEFELPLYDISKTKAQISAKILGATQIKRDDEFELVLPNNIILGEYEYLRDHFINWAKNVKDYSQITLNTLIANVPHVLGVGGLHGAIKNYIGDGIYLMVDVASYYPAGMIEYALLSRNVLNPKLYRKIRDERLVMKANKDPRQAPRKIVLNGTFGASKDKYNGLYDPRQANSLCIMCQLFLVDLIEKLEKYCELIQLTQWLNQNHFFL